MSNRALAGAARESTGCQHKSDLILRAGLVTRYHTEPDVPPQTVGLHTWRMTTLMLSIWPDCSRDLILAALYHDVAEVFTGDAPAPLKWSDPELTALLRALEQRFTSEVLEQSRFELTGSEIARMKVADYLELSDYCSRFRTEGAERVCRAGARAVGRYAVRLNADDGHQLAEFLREAQLRGKFKGKGVGVEIVRIIENLNSGSFRHV